MLPLVIILLLALIYGYLNGQHASASIVATMLSSHALGPRRALLLATIGMFAGPFLMGVAVASTIGSQLVAPDATTVRVVLASLTGAIVWSGLTLWLRMPGSISQALIGGLVGAVWAGYGAESVLLPGLLKVLAGVFVSPLLGMVTGFVFVRVSYFLGRAATPRINIWFNRGQVLVALFMALAFGANDGQKIIGVVVLGLAAVNIIHGFSVPIWVVLFTSSAVALGTLRGGWRLITTLGNRFYKIRPVHGFNAQLASGVVIFSAGILGAPVSGSQVVTTAIVGAGSADRLQKVRWGVVRGIVWSWLLTLPVSAAVGAITYWVMGAAIH